MRNLVRSVCIFIFLLTVLSIANADFLGQYGPGDVVVYSVVVSVPSLDTRINADSIFAWIFDPNDNVTPTEKDTLEFRHTGHVDSIGFYWDSLTVPATPTFGTWAIHINMGVGGNIRHTTHHFQVMKMADDSLTTVLSTVVELLDTLQLWDDDIALLGTIRDTGNAIIDTINVWDADIARLSTIESDASDILDTLKLWDDDIDDIIPIRDTVNAIIDTINVWDTEIASLSTILYVVSSTNAWSSEIAKIDRIMDSTNLVNDSTNAWSVSIAKITGIQDTVYALIDSSNTWAKWAALTDIDSLETQTQRLVDSTSAGTWSTATASVTSVQDSLNKAMVAFYAQGMDSTTYKYYVNSSTQRYDSILTMNYAKTDTSTIMRYYFSTSGALDSVKVEKWR